MANVNYAVANTANQYIQGGLEVTTSTNGGNVTVTAKLYVRRTNSYGSSTNDSSVAMSITIDGTVTSKTAAVDIAGGQQNVWQGPVLTATKTFTGSAKNINVSWSMKGAYTTNFNGSGSASFSVPAGYVAPSGGYITITGKTYNSVTAKVGVSSFGIPAVNKELDFKVLEAAYTEERPTRQSNYLANGDTTTVNNSSAVNGNGLTIIGNKLYYTGLYASNGALSYKFQGPTFTTPCPPLSALAFQSHSYEAYNKEKAVIAWTRQSDGGALARTLYYRYSSDGGKTYGNWISLGTVTAGSGTFTISGLPTAKSIIVQAKLVTSAGESETKSCSFTTLATHTAPNFSNFTYADANEKVTELIGSDQAFLQGQSTPAVKVLAKNKATGNQSIKISAYSITFSGESYPMEYSDSEDVSKSLNKPSQSGTLALRVAAVDALSLSKAVDKNVVVYPWTAPKISANISRLGGFESSCTLSIKGSYSPISVGGSVKNTVAVAYRLKKSSSTDWGEWQTRAITIDGENWTTDDLAITLDNNSQWDIQVRAVDKFTTTTADLLLPVGMPKFFIGKDGRTSIGKRPEYDMNGMSGELEVAGRIYAAGDCYSGGTSDNKRLARTEEVVSLSSSGTCISMGTTALNNYPAKTGFYMGYDGENRPIGVRQGNDWWYVEQIVHNSLYRIQIAQSFFQERHHYIRRMENGIWQSWQRIMDSRTTLDQCYPVGSVYVSITLDTPAKVASALGGGTWVRTFVGRAIVGVDESQNEFKTANSGGGTKTVTLTTAEIPKHDHSINVYFTPYINSSNGNRTGNAFASTAYKWGNNASYTVVGGAAVANQRSDGGGAHSNLQPYGLAYVYQRTA